MAATTTKKRTIAKVAPTDTAAEKKPAESAVEKKTTTVKKEEPTTEIKQFNQNDLILCRSVTAGWLGVSGKSGQYYVFENFGDECEIEYQDLFALKSRHSQYIYAPLFVIENEELLENPRWKDVAQFYDEKVFQEDIDEILNLPIGSFETTLKALPKGLAKALQVKVAEKIEEGTFDSLKKIKIIDDVFGTDFRSILAE